MALPRSGLMARIALLVLLCMFAIGANARTRMLTSKPTFLVRQLIARSYRDETDKGEEPPMVYTCDEDCQDQLRPLFDEVDLDKDGYVTLSEIKKAIEKYGGDESDEEIKEYFMEADTNEDEQISFEEVVEQVNKELANYSMDRRDRSRYGDRP